MAFDLLRVLVASIISSLVCQVVAQGNGVPDPLAGRDNHLLERKVYNARTGSAANFGEMPLDGKSLVASWLGKRQGGCVDSGYSPCTNDDFTCCPTGNTCCSFGCCDANQSCCGTSFCADPGEKCCSFGTCPSGFGCCGVGTCYPLDGECCEDGNYCTAGNHCYLVDGLGSCCTDSHCTAHVDGGVTLTGFGYTGTRAPPAAPTTAANSPSAAQTTQNTVAVTLGNFQYYYFTVTWYYYSFFYTFSTSSTRIITDTSSSHITTSTIVSIYDTNSLSATSRFRSLSATLSTPTPVEATALPTLPSQTQASTPTAAGGSSGSSNSVSGAQSGASHLEAGWGVSGCMAAYLLAALTSGLCMLML